MTELLCIQTHSKKAVIAGNIYMLISDKMPCKCDNCFNVGIRASGEYYANGNGGIIGKRYICSNCNELFIEDGWAWISKSLFAQIGTTDECKQYEKELDKQLI